MKIFVYFWLVESSGLLHENTHYLFLEKIKCLTYKIKYYEE